MAEIGGKYWQQPLHISALTVPSGQAVNREAVPVMPISALQALD